MIELKNANITTGTLEFPADLRVRAEQASDGLVLHLPARVTFRSARDHGAPAYLTDVSERVSHEGKQVGIGSDPRFYWGEGPSVLSVAVPISARVLASVERARNGKSPKFRIDVMAKTGLVLGQSYQLAMPYTLASTIERSIERDEWIDLLRTTGCGQNIVAEVALPADPEPPWDDVWKALRHANEVLDRGGPTAWKGCVADCRTTLEKWQEIEPLDVGARGTAPEDLSRPQRLDVLRQAVTLYTHEAVHDTGDATTRAEAVMTLTTVSAILGVRCTR